MSTTADGYHAFYWKGDVRPHKHVIKINVQLKCITKKTIVQNIETKIAKVTHNKTQSTAGAEHTIDLYSS